jgi:hypothetical protein
MTVTVTPERFTLLNYDAGRIVEIAEGILSELGLDDDLVVEIDETSPIARTVVTDGAPVVVHAESGAFEEPKQPRSLSDANTGLALARVLLRLRDRRAGFADAPPDAELTLRQVAAWDVYCVGRYARLGHQVNRQRFLYNFRNRHGFTDTADHVFDRLWNSDDLTWQELDELSASADAARQPA